MGQKKIGRPSGSTTINQGVSQLARELGLSKTTISRRLRAGETMAQIAAVPSRGGRSVKGRRGVGTRKAREAAVQKQALAAGKVYVPPRAGKRAELLARNEAEARGLVQPAFVVDGGTMFPPPEQPLELEMEARTRKLTAEANEREIIVAQKAGALVSIATINQWFGAAILKARDMLIFMCNELAEPLAAEEDPVVVKLTLRREVDRVLNVLKLMGREGEAVDVPPEQAEI
jgi:hypothetical protein